MKSNYYLETIPLLIEKYKSAIEQCLDVIDKAIDEDLSDDKLHNVLKAKRIAGDDVKYYAKEIESMENEMNGVEVSGADPVSNQREKRRRYTE